MMRCGNVLWVSTVLSVLALGMGLQCYSCHTRTKCDGKQQCGKLNSCVKVVASTGGMVVAKCINYADCDFQKLASSYPAISSFTFNCCQSDLCNSSHSLRASPLIGLLASMAALLWAMH